MSIIFQTTFSDAFSRREIIVFLHQILLKFLPEGPVSSKSALVRVTGHKPLPETVMTQLTAAYVTRGPFY